MRQVIIFLLLVGYLVYFSFQPVQDQLNEVRGQFMENSIHQALTSAQIKGYFTEADLLNVQDYIASGLGYPTGNVDVNGTQVPQTRGNSISLSVSIPTTISFLHMQPQNDSATISRSETVTSEAILP